MNRSVSNKVTIAPVKAYDGLYPDTLIDLLQQRAHNHSDEIAYTFLLNGETVAESTTFAQLDTAARRIAASFQNLQAYGERALLLLPAGIDFIRAYLGCIYAGVVAVPAYPPRRNRGDARLAAIAADAQARFIVASSELAKQSERFRTYAPELLSRQWLAIEALTQTPAARWQPPAINGDTIAFLQYTSGSTGTPKGVMVSHHNVLHNERYMHDYWPFTASSVMVSWLPMFHDMGLIYGVLHPLFQGRPSYLMSPAAFVQHPLRWLKALSRFAGTHTAAPNFAYALCADKFSATECAGLDLSAWQYAMNGAEPVRAETFERFEDLFGPYGLRPHTLRHCFGMAEATLCVTGAGHNEPTHTLHINTQALTQHQIKQAEPGAAATPFVSAGKAQADTQVSIVDPATLQPCPSERVGEIWVAGPGVAQGYWQRPEATAATFAAYLDDGRGPFMRTGDLGFMTPDNSLFITGRLKDVLIFHGGNYYPQDIELAAHRSYAGLRADGAAAFTVTDGGAEKLVIAQEIERTALKNIDTDAAMLAIRQAVADTFDIQTHAICLLRPATLPKTSSGKVQRGLCRDYYLQNQLKQVAAWARTNSPSPIDPAVTMNSPPLTQTELQQWLVTRLAAHLQVPPEAIALDQPLARLGLDSMTAVAISGELSERLCQSVSPTLVYDYPTIQTLAQHVLGASPTPTHTDQAAGQYPPSQTAIAIIGMGCRFPGAANPEAFAEVLRRGQARTGTRPERLVIPEHYRQQAGEQAAALDYGGFLDNVAGFDATFFGISPLEAKRMDPQQRLLLEVVWETFEHAGLPPASLAGSRCGVFIGVSNDDYSRLQQQAGLVPDLYAATGQAFSVVANRISYLFDLRGPSIAVDTACSSSLVAVHQARQALLQGECDLALVGGVNLILEGGASLSFAKAGMLAPDGCCKAFDAGANGYVRGEGCGVVLLKRQDDAKRDQDRVLALLRGSAVNQDGRTNGLTAPNGLSQQAVVQAALTQAGIRPGELDYVEAHGTGTRLGDPIEINALQKTLQTDRAAGHTCWIGSVKANIGHLEAAAGIAGLIKTILTVQHGEVFPQPHFHALNPLIEQPAAIATEPRPQAVTYAGVSSFGFGGSNAHVVLARAEPVKSPAAPNLPALLTLAAQDEIALQELAGRYAARLATASPEELTALCDLSNRGRDHLPQRLATVVTADANPAELLQAFAQGRGHLAQRRAKRAAPAIVFLFTGQGAQYSGMGKALYEHEPAFRLALDRCAALLADELDIALTELLFDEAHAAQLNQTGYTQPALFALEYALAQQWQAWGIRPGAVLGHSLGEYVAATIAGCLDLPAALRLVTTRARLMQALPQDGAMAAVFGEQTHIQTTLAAHPEISIAAYNTPTQMTLAGAPAALARATQALQAEGLNTRTLAVSQAFHSAHLEPMLAELAAAADALPCQPPQLPLLSNLTGSLLEQAPDGAYWRAHSRQPVQFQQGIETLFELGYTDFLEIGPKPLLNKLGQACAPAEASHRWLSSLAPPRADPLALRDTLAELYISGAPIDWTGYHQGRPRQIVSAPSYPFQRQTYWFQEMPITSPGETAQHAAPARDTLTPSTSHQDAPPPGINRLRTLVAELLQADPDRLDPERSLVELGADSLIMQQLIQRIESQFGITLSIRQLFTELATLTALEGHLDAAGIDLTLTTTAPDTPPRSNAAGMPNESQAPAGTAVEALLREQLQTVSTTLNQIVSQQLAFLQQTDPSTAASLNLPGSLSGQANAASASTPASQGEPPGAAAAKTATAPAGNTAARGAAAAVWGQAAAQNGSLTSQQQHHIAELSARYTRRTARSKAMEQQYRRVFSDMRSTLGFRFETKEMCYPIYADTGQGAYVTDLDGNQYIDLAMGFGVHLFGHRPEFLATAIAEPLQNGMPLAVQSPQAGRVATLLTELTGTERVAFCNSGTEAVMTALRLARKVTGRAKIVMFSGAYHGHSDGTLASAQGDQTIPLAPGVLPGMIDQVKVLPYGDEASLERIRAQAGELAAVLVEPVQSRRPALQPREFLQALRAITAASGTALIFDEMITGFRIHPGGAQAWFDVQADLVTYGKILGGGLPIGAVAGRATYLDAIDGGPWQYGDDSYPAVTKTFYAGTFAKHPLAMAAATAVLEHLQQSGEALLRDLNHRTAELSARLNAWFEAEAVPIRMQHFGSLFRFGSADPVNEQRQPLEMDLLSYHLIEQGLYLWERRTCFLGTAHSDTDIAAIEAAVVASVRALQAGGFMAGEAPAPAPADALTNTPAPGNSAAAPASSADSTPTTVPLTLAQQQLWVLPDVAPEAALAYHLSLDLSLHGNLDSERLRHALTGVSRRHAALRAAFDSSGEHIHIASEALPVWWEEDYSALAPAEREAAVIARLQQDNQQPFNFQQAPLMRVGLIRLASEHYLLALTMPHIIADGWSLEVLGRELLTAYHNPASTAPAPLQWPEYVAQHQQQLASPQLAEHEAFWLSELGDDRPPPLQLPGSRLPKGSPDYRGARVIHPLSSALTAQIKAFSQQQGCTPFMTLLAVYSLLLHRLSGQDDILIGLPVGGRPFAGSESVIGFCAHLVVLRSRFTPTATFREHLQATRGRLLTAYQHQDYPFASLLEKLAGARRQATNNPAAPLVNLVFNLDQAAAITGTEALEITPYLRPVDYVAFDLIVNVRQAASGEWLLIGDYRRALLTQTQVQHWLETYCRLLSDALAQPTAPAAELALLSTTEINQLRRWNQTTTASADNPPALIDLLETQADQTPAHTALVFADQVVTYRELNQRANQLAHYLRQYHEIGPDTLVALYTERSIEMMIGLLGILKAGGAYVPLAPEYPAERRRYMLNDSQAKLLLTQRHLQTEDQPALASQVVCLDKPGLLAEQPTHNPAPVNQPADLAYVIYTSGSTGQPKGVMIERRALVNCLQAIQAQLHFSDQDRLLALTTLAFDIAGLELFLPLLTGGSIQLVATEDSLDPECIKGYLADPAITVAQATPATWQMLRASDWQQTTPGTLLCGGEALPPILGEYLTANSIQLWNLYGPTETTIWSTIHDVTQMPQAPDLIGQPLANTRVYILDAHHQPQPIGIPGELCIAGAGLARGYLNRPELTAERFIELELFGHRERLYKTGDLARWREDGHLEYLGRLDHQVKLRGFRIELGEIEATLTRHDAVSEAVVVLHEQTGNKSLVAYVVPREPGMSSSLTASLREWLTKHLPEYMIPANFTILDKLPLTPNGKIDRQALPEPEWLAGIEHTPAATATEAQLSRIWGEILAIEAPSVTASFFDLGGHSLLATQVTSAIWQQLEVRIPARLFFENPTIRELSKYIDFYRLEFDTGKPAEALRAEEEEFEL